MSAQRVMVITGTRKGIGRHLAHYYVEQGFEVIGCSRGVLEDAPADHYEHIELDVGDETAVRRLFAGVRRRYGRLDALINNAGVASMNHALLTPAASLHKVLDVNVVGSFLACREGAKVMKRSGGGRIVNFSTVAVPLRLAGEAVYTASKAAVESLTRVLAREFADLGITVNAVGPTPIATDLIRNIPEKKIQALIERQAIRRLGEMQDVTNVIDFFLRPESDFITGQIVYLGGV